jgi:hypothetical protein
MYYTATVKVIDLRGSVEMRCRNREQMAQRQRADNPRMPAERTEPTWAEVKAAYWRNHRAMRQQAPESSAITDLADYVPNPDFWAWEYVREVCGSGDRAALDRLVDLADSASNDEQLAYLGAGPVEDFVSGFGGLLIDDIEEAASTSPSFLRALRGMYPTEIPESVRVRMLPLVPASSRENRVREKYGLAPL